MRNPKEEEESLLVVYHVASEAGIVNDSLTCVASVCLLFLPQLLWGYPLDLRGNLRLEIRDFRGRI